MAQRRSHSGLKRIARRYGATGNKVALGALVALSCFMGVGGMLWQARDGGMLIERSLEETKQDVTSSTDEIPQANTEEERAEENAYCVHVDGAVAHPGVVELTGSDLRVCDAVDAAGGLMDDADTTAVNLAESLCDGTKIYIPHHDDEAVGAAASSPGQVQTVGATQSGAGSALVNINTATTDELQTLAGIGEVTARTILEDRERNGPFASPEDLMRVSGIGEKKFEKVRDSICV